MAELLQSLGVEVSHHAGRAGAGDVGRGLTGHVADYDIVRKMRASILVLGPLLARVRHCIRLPARGLRDRRAPGRPAPAALEAMGAEMDLRDGYVHAKAPAGGLRGGASVSLLVSVGATENALMAATLAQGHHGSEERRARARDRRSRGMPACAWGPGSRARAPRPSPSRGSTAAWRGHAPVVADRIELGTYMLAPAICRRRGRPAWAGGSTWWRPSASQAGGGGHRGEETGSAACAWPHRPGARRRCGDGALSRLSHRPSGADDGADVHRRRHCVLEERIFENRFMHAPELMRMGARIDVHGGTATVTGSTG